MIPLIILIIASFSTTDSKSTSVDLELIRSGKSNTIYVSSLPNELKRSSKSRIKRTVTESDEDIILDQLNNRRRQYNAANMQYVKWDPQLESFASMWSRSCVASTQVSKSTYVNQSLVGSLDNKFLPLAEATYSIFSGFANRSQLYSANLYAIGCTRTFCPQFIADEEEELINITVYACIVGFKSPPEEIIQFGEECSRCPSTHPICISGLCAEMGEEDYLSSSEVGPPLIANSSENLSTRTLATVTPYPMHTVKAPSSPLSSEGDQPIRTTVRPTTIITPRGSVTASCSRSQGSNCATDSGSSNSTSRSTLGVVIGVICGAVLLFVLLVISTIHVVICTRRKRLEQRRIRGSAPRSRSSSVPGSASVYSVSQGIFEGPPPSYALATNYPVPPPPYSERSVSYASLAPPYESIELPKYSDVVYMEVNDSRGGSSTSGYISGGNSNRNSDHTSDSNNIGANNSDNYIGGCNNSNDNNRANIDNNGRGGNNSYENIVPTSGNSSGRINSADGRRDNDGVRSNGGDNNSDRNVRHATKSDINSRSDNSRGAAVTGNSRAELSSISDTNDTYENTAVPRNKVILSPVQNSRPTRQGSTSRGLDNCTRNSSTNGGLDDGIRTDSTRTDSISSCLENSIRNDTSRWNNSTGTDRTNRRLSNSKKNESTRTDSTRTDSTTGLDNSIRTDSTRADSTNRGRLHYNAVYDSEYTTDDESMIQRIRTESESTDISASDIGVNNRAFYDSDTASIPRSRIQSIPLHITTPNRCDNISTQQHHIPPDPVNRINQSANSSNRTNPLINHVNRKNPYDNPVNQSNSCVNPVNQINSSDNSVKETNLLPNSVNQTNPDFALRRQSSGSVNSCVTASSRDSECDDNIGMDVAVAHSAGRMNHGPYESS